MILPELETERLQLKQFQSSDTADLFKIFSDPEVMQYVGKSGAKTWTETEAGLIAMMQRWQHGFGMWAVVEQRSGLLVGRCGLTPLDNTSEIELGYTFAKAHWGKGFATEAAKASLKFGFEALKLDRVVAIAYPENLPSRRVMEKLGMKYEKNAYCYGVEVVYYAIAQTNYQPDSSPYTLRLVDAPPP